MNSPDKLDILMNKLTQLEEAFKQERIIRLSREEENKNLKTITIPNLEKQIEEKEIMFKNIFIEKIKLEKQMNSISEVRLI